MPARSFLPGRMPFSLKPAATLSKIDMVGNGFGRWKTMPTLPRICTGSTPGRRCPRRRGARARRPGVPGTVSCMRFRQRTKVDLPHPDGPMMAVTARSGRSRLMSWSAWVAPNQALQAGDLELVHACVRITDPSPRQSRVKRRTERLVAAISVMSTRAPAQAWRCQSSKGEMA